MEESRNNHRYSVNQNYQIYETAIQAESSHQEEHEYVNPRIESVRQSLNRPSSILLEGMINQMKASKQRIDHHALQQIIETRIQEDERAYLTLKKLKSELISSLTICEMGLQDYKQVRKGHQNKSRNLMQQCLPCLFTNNNA